MPSIRVRKGYTLMLYGPASATLVEGRVSVLGCPLAPRMRLIVRSWRARPIYAERDSVIDFTYGENGGYEVIEGDTIPGEWRDFAERVSERPSRVCVYGGVDSGKTSLATLILNNLIRRQKLAVYMDLDLGQSNICPPTTIGYVSLRVPAPDISYYRLEAGEVVGYTSPTPLVEKHLKAVEKLASRLHARYHAIGASIDLDGWISGEGAIGHKRELARILRPDYIASLGDLPDEIRETCEDLGIEFEVLPTPKEVRRRDQAARRRLRELSYQRFLRGAIVRKIPASWVELRTIADGTGLTEVKKHVEALLQDYAEASGEILDQSVEKSLESLARAGVGLLSYLRDPSGTFAGIGLLISPDFRKNYLRILTPYRGPIKELIVGVILLSMQGEEVYSSPKPLILSSAGEGAPTSS